MMGMMGEGERALTRVGLPPQWRLLQTEVVSTERLSGWRLWDFGKN